MLDYEYTRVRNIPLTELHNPEYSAVLIKYAGEMAPACVAESLFQKLKTYEFKVKNTPILT
jgi:hypothetical protein